MLYQELLDELKSLANEKYKDFHKKLLKNDGIKVLGVRIPYLRKIAKKCNNCVDELLTFPDEFYEVTFVKLTTVSYLEYGQFLKYLDKCVSLIDNWATCDCFVPKCIEKHKDEFLPYISRYSLMANNEFVQRFALTTLLHFYVEEKYLCLIKDIIQRVHTEFYYVHMAAAWLIAEMLVKYYDETLPFIRESYESGLKGGGILDKKTHNKAIQKARESYRLSDERKNYLKGLKR